MSSSERPVAVVTGASRGVGAGVAKALGEKGALVYLAGRTIGGSAPARPDEAALPGTLEEAARAVDAAGGKGVPVVCDMAEDDQVRALFDQVRRDSGRLDILVNNAAFLHNDMGKPGPFWERALEMADIIDVGLRCHFVATWCAAPLLLAAGRGLVVNISFYGGARMHDPAYYAAKAGLDKMADAFADDFRPHGVAAVSLWPGLVATERVRLLAEQHPALSAQLPAFETPEFIGRVVAALHADPGLMALSGKTLIAAEVARRYGLRDSGEREPASYREAFGGPHPAFDAPPPAVP